MTHQRSMFKSTENIILHKVIEQTEVIITKLVNKVLQESFATEINVELI